MSLDIALKCIRRGWYVFPCVPRGKFPITKHGALDATNDEAQVVEWWNRNPKANVGIATGPSGLTVLDIDAGVENELGVALFRMAKNLPPTYTVRTGRRDGFGVQMYFQTEDALQSIGWVDEELKGDVRSATGYVIAEGCTHPSGALYERLLEAPIALTPGWVKGLKSAARDVVSALNNPTFHDDGGKITADRHVALLSLLGKKRQAGYEDWQVEEFAYQVNAKRFEPPLEDGEVDRMVAAACKYPVGEAEVEVILGGKSPGVAPVDWKLRYHSFEEMDQAPPPSFLIEGFLQEDSITGLAAPVAQRKSLIALNVAHALCTGEALFDRFAVTRKPSRVLYICPEMGLISFTERVRAIGLLPYVGKTFFCTTMNSERFHLNDITAEELADSVVVLDTAIRFLEGSESDSKDMKVFASQIFRLKNQGAAAILLLHHSPKTTKDASELTLENTMRGSGELGAFLTSCWATKLVNPDNEYESPSYIRNVKQRDFKSDPFRAVSDKTFRMTWIPEEDGAKASLKNFGKDKDGKQAEAIVFIEAHPKDSAQFISEGLKGIGIKRSRAWVQMERARLKGTGIISVTS